MIKYKVIVTAESPPRNHEFWTLNGHFDKKFKTFAEAEAYVEKIEALQSQSDRDDEYYDRFGPICEIVKVTK